MTPSQAIDHLHIIHPELRDSPHVTAKIIKEFLNLINEEYLDRPVFLVTNNVDNPIIWSKIKQSVLQKILF